MSMAKNSNTRCASEPVFGGRTTLEHAATATEAVRAINQLTRHDDALPLPSDAYPLICELATAVYRFPQAFAQIAGRIRRWHEAGQLGFDRGSPYADHADQAVQEVRRSLNQDAARAADNPARVLDTTAQLLAAAHYAGPLHDEARP
jgi:hypothetical protein